MNLRPADADDEALLLAWRNDPLTRAMSLDTTEVSAEGHAAWLKKTLADPARELWIAEVDGVPVAQIRLDLVEPEVAMISISAAPEARGRGYAAAALADALTAQRLGASRFRATVRGDNAASLRLFERAGFSALQRDGSVVLFERAAEPAG